MSKCRIHRTTRHWVWVRINTERKSMRRLLLMSPLFLLMLGCQRAQSSLYSAGRCPPDRGDAMADGHPFPGDHAGYVGADWLGCKHASGHAGRARAGRYWRRPGMDRHRRNAHPVCRSVCPVPARFKLLASFPIADPGQANTKPDILIIAHQWWWEVHYLNDQPLSFRRPPPMKSIFP